MKKVQDYEMGRPNNQAGCTYFGKLINWQSAISSEVNKRVCWFIKQMRVLDVRS